MTEVQKILAQIVGLCMVILSVYAYGLYQHHQGFKECKADYDLKAEQLKKESKDAIKAEHDQADTDKQFLADYYGRLLSNRNRVQSGGVQTTSASGVLSAASQCHAIETDMRFEQGCAQDAAKLLRVTGWLKAVGINPE